jgi:hypothetical protein
VVLTLAVLWIVYLAILGPGLYPLDDAYITQHNALALIAGKDANFPGVSALYGSTSLVHLLLVSLFGLVLPIGFGQDLVGWLAAIAYALGLLALARNMRVSATWALALAALGLSAASSPAQMLNGLETGLAMAAITWALAFAAQSSNRRALPILCGVLPFIRPELAAWSAMLLGMLLVRRFRADPLREALLSFAADLGLALAAAAPFLLIYALATGSLGPPTVKAKEFYFAEGCAPASFKLTWVKKSAFEFALLLGLTGAGFALGLRSALGWINLAFAAVFFYVYYKTFPGALAHYDYRYLYIFVPLAMYGFAVGLSDRRALIRGITVALVLASLTQALWDAPGRFRHMLDERRFTRDELEPVAAFAREHLPPNATVLVHDVGYVSTATSLHLVDMVGLKTPSSVPVNFEFIWKPCGRSRGAGLNKIAINSGAKYFIVLAEWDRIYKLTGSLRWLGWQLTPLRPGNPAYQVYALTPPAYESRDREALDQCRLAVASWPPNSAVRATGHLALLGAVSGPTHRISPQPSAAPAKFHS